MSHTLLISTRKGLFTVEGAAGKWRVTRSSFIGDNVTLAVSDPRDSQWYAALDHGHFGVKLHRSDNRGESWQEIAAPSYPTKPENLQDTMGDGRPVPWTTKLIWSLAPGGEHAPGVLWAGTIPGGLFQSKDHGDTWQLNTALWEHPARQQWFGGGADYPGIHSICVHPTQPQRLVVGVSCGGAWATDDGGDTWRNCSAGMWAAYVPPAQKDDPNIQDPHCITQCSQHPDTFWAQHHNGIFALQMAHKRGPKSRAPTRPTSALLSPSIRLIRTQLGSFPP